MATRKGFRIVVDSNKVGTPPRSGEVLEVIPGPASDHFRVRWDDGHESVFFPGPGTSVHTEPGD